MDGERVIAAGIQHVALEIESTDAERAVEFWNLLGFDRVPTPPSLSGRAIWMQPRSPAPATQIHLLFVDLPQAPPDADGGSGSRAAGGHVAIVPADYEPALAALRQAGFPVADRRAHWGAARAYAAHPGGHTVELMAAPPPLG